MDLSKPYIVRTHDDESLKPLLVINRRCGERGKRVPVTVEMIAAAARRGEFMPLVVNMLLGEVRVVGDGYVGLGDEEVKNGEGEEP